MKATSIADVSEGIVLARIEIAAPPERVWKAITTDELAKWWGSDEMYRTTKHTVDLRVGGRYRSEGKGADGHAFHVAGEILEVDAPRKLVQTWEPSWVQGAATTVAWLLDPTPTGTRVTVRHTGFQDPAACNEHATGWTRVLGWLGGHSGAEAPPRFFMARLIPPRPGFMLDMTSEEREVMLAHSKYWRKLLAEGHAVAFGPVSGPTGGFGLGILKAADEAALHALQAEDPAILSKRGFAYENAPMVTLVY
jgi:uncharacterized protein YndB with AHSA1/START domain/uncharacterized protein YciI